MYTAWKRCSAGCLGFLKAVAEDHAVNWATVESLVMGFLVAMKTLTAEASIIMAFHLKVLKAPPDAAVDVSRVTRIQLPIFALVWILYVGLILRAVVQTAAMAFVCLSGLYSNGSGCVTAPSSHLDE